MCTHIETYSLTIVRSNGVLALYIDLHSLRFSYDKWLIKICLRKKAIRNKTEQNKINLVIC